MQEDARYLLTRISQEVRMTGMFGCIDTSRITPPVNDVVRYNEAIANPVTWTIDPAKGNRLMLVTADVGSSGTTPTWTIMTDCKLTATAYNNAAVVPAGQMAFLLRQVYYSYRDNTIFTGPTDAQQPLVSNVSDFTVMFGLSSTADGTDVKNYVAIPTPVQMPMIRTVRLTLTLKDPNGLVGNQTYSVVAAIRNRLE
jgi:type IV pilus assembly protein PilW